MRGESMASLLGCAEGEPGERRGGAGVAQDTRARRRERSVTAALRQGGASQSGERGVLCEDARPWDLASRPGLRDSA